MRVDTVQGQDLLGSTKEGQVTSLDNECSLLSGLPVLPTIPDSNVLIILSACCCPFTGEIRPYGAPAGVGQSLVSLSTGVVRLQRIHNFFAHALDG
jgi:hypothetical protein